MVVRSLPSWLESRFQDNLTNPSVRFEASQYGPINAILGHVFPIEQTFMVKPQGKLQPLKKTEAKETDNPKETDDSMSTDGSEEADDLMATDNLEETDKPRTSFDSYSNDLQPRGSTKEKGKKKGINEPDFIIVKSGPKFGDDKPIAIVEVKRNKHSNDESIAQMERYMRHVSMMEKCVGDVKGFLVSKEDTWIFSGKLKDGEVVFARFSDTRMHFKTNVEIVAEAYWQT
jgi:hypothetical protein